MRRTLTLLLLVAATALLALGCGSDDNGGATTGGGAATTAPAATSPSTSGGGDTVTIKLENTTFNPKEAAVKVGQKVEWENEDSFDHNVVAQEGEDFKSENFGQGGKFEYTADTAGTIQYVCTLHPGMEGTLTVTE